MTTLHLLDYHSMARMSLMHPYHAVPCHHHFFGAFAYLYMRIWVQVFSYRLSIRPDYRDAYFAAALWERPVLLSAVKHGSSSDGVRVSLDHYTCILADQPTLSGRYSLLLQTCLRPPLSVSM